MNIDNGYNNNLLNVTSKNYFHTFDFIYNIYSNGDNIIYLSLKEELIPRNTLFNKIVTI